MLIQNCTTVLGFEPALGARLPPRTRYIQKDSIFLKTLLDSGYVNMNISIERSYVH